MEFSLVGEDTMADKKDGIKAHKARLEKHNQRPPMTREEIEYARRKAAYRKKRRRKRQIQRIVLIAVMLLILFVLLWGCRKVVKGVSGNDKKAETNAETTDSQAETGGEATAVITTAGDIVMHSPIFESSLYYDGENYDFNPIFEYIKDDYQAADFTVLTTEF